jgi:hypothetical protein
MVGVELLDRLSKKGANKSVDKYIESQLIMISPNKLAQYWVGFGHISFYERVNIDQFLNPANDPSPTVRETPFS